MTNIHITRSKVSKVRLNIMELYKQLQPITQEQKEYAYDLFFGKNLVYKTQSGVEKAICTHCGKKYVVAKNEVCPQCGEKRELNRRAYVRNLRKIIFYFRTTDVVGEWYVLRHFFVKAEFNKDTICKDISEVNQIWLTCNKNGKLIKQTLAKRISPMSYDNYMLDSDFSFKNNYECGYYASKYEVDCDTYPSNVVPQWAKNYGWNGTDEDITDMVAFLRYLVDKDNHDVEKFYKMGQKAVASYLAGTRHYLNEELRKVIMVAHRHKKIIRDVTLFRDYISDLEYFGKDTHNPKYLTISDEEMLREHNVMTERRRIIEERERQERERERREKELLAEKQHIANYLNKMNYFSELIIASGNIIIKPIMSVDDVQAEGENMKHCVFSMGYYKKDNVLLLSAVDINGNRLETIEYNMDSMKIVQHRGKCNSQTEWGNTICTMIESKKSKINKLYKKYKLAV